MPNVKRYVRYLGHLERQMHFVLMAAEVAWYPVSVISVCEFLNIISYKGEVSLYPNFLILHVSGSGAVAFYC